MLTAEHKTFYKALIARDPRYDGRIYFGVTTTGIYCRPVCSAQPKIQNVKFYKSKAEAEKEGFRPCLRCRPDLSPLSPQWQGTAAVMSRALRLIETHEDETQLSKIAERLGMSDRHLRRLFQEHIGVSPLELMISKRLHLARQLLSQSAMPVLDVALASGFKSLRRFNDAFVKVYKKSPREFRQQVQMNEANKKDLKLELTYTEPFDWDYLLTFFRRHQIHGTEFVDDTSYSRHLRIAHDMCFFKITHDEKRKALSVSLKINDLSVLKDVIVKIRTQFDLAHNPHHIGKQKLKDVVQVRVPGSYDAFAVAVSIILGQLVSVEQGRENIKKLVLKYGERLDQPTSEGLTHLFPEASVLKNADFKDLGYTQMRCAAIRELAQLYDGGELDLSGTCDLQKTREQLLNIKGIGPWTVEMIAMRCLRDADAFPARDLIIERAVNKFKIKSEKISPWRAYLALAIWKTQAHKLTNKSKRKKSA